MTAEGIAAKYVHGDHDALTDSQEKKDMTKDIEAFARQKTVELEMEREESQKFNSCYCTHYVKKIKELKRGSDFWEKEYIDCNAMWTRRYNAIRDRLSKLTD